MRVRLRRASISSIRRFSHSILYRTGHDRQVRDVVPGDLGATLKAHRESNVKAKIRRIKSPSSGTWNSNWRKTIESSAVPKEEQFRRCLEPLEVERESEHEQQNQLTQASLSKRQSRNSNYLVPCEEQHDKVKEGSSSTEPLQINIGESSYDSPYSPSYQKQLKSSDGNEAIDDVSMYKRVLTTNKLDEANAHTKGSFVEPYRRRTRRPLGNSESPYLNNVKPSLLQNRAALLDQLISNVESWTRTTKQEYEARQEVLSSIYTFLQPRFPELDFDVFGSSKTGLTIPSSDIDVRFMMKSSSTHERLRPVTSVTAKSFVYKMKNRLDTKKSGFEVVQVIPSGRAPLISLLHVSTGLNVQVVATSGGERVLPFVQAYLDEFPQLRPLFILMKLTLNTRHLHEPSKGGIGAYTLFNMLVAYFKGFAATRTDTLSSNLIRFLRFYAKFDTLRAGISVDPPAIFPKRDGASKPKKEEANTLMHDAIRTGRNIIGVRRSRDQYSLCLQDPSNPGNDLGISSYRFLDVQSMCRQLHDGLIAWLDDEDPIVPNDSRANPIELNDDGVDSQQIVLKEHDPLKPFLGDILELMLMKRRRVKAGKQTSKGG